MIYEVKDYEVVQFKPGDFQDNYGNYWCDMALRGVGEPVRIVVKDPSQYHDGMTLHGTVEEKTSKANKPYLRFKKVDREEQQQDAHLSPAGGTTKKEWIPRDDDAIRAQWAIGQAIQLYTTWNKERPELEDVEATATKLFAMVKRVKAPMQVQTNLVTAETSVEEIQARAEATRDAERLRNTTRDELVDVGEEPINLDDIPF